jgi:hypothetical protein
MLRSIQKIFDPVLALIQSEKVLKKLYVSPEEKEGLDMMITFLEKLEKITISLSSEKASISELPIFYHGLLIHLTNFENNENIGYIVKEMKTEFLRVLYLYIILPIPINYLNKIYILLLDTIYLRSSTIKASLCIGS